MRHAIGVLILETILIGACSSAGPRRCTETLGQFLDSPSRANYSRWNTCRAASEDCKRLDFDNDRRARLRHLVRSGNSSALRVGILASSCWDGGELEDFYRSAGEFFDRAPGQFAQVIREEEVPGEQLRRMLLMLPLELTDNLPEKLVLIRQRVSKVRALSGSSLGADTEQTIAALNEFERKLRHISDRSRQPR